MILVHTSKKEISTKMTKNTTSLPFLIDYIPEEIVQAAEEELHETPERKTRELANLMFKIKDSDVLNDVDFEHDYLVQFLRVSKYNADTAFSRLKKYVNFRRKHPNFFTGVGDRLSSNSSFSWVTPLPRRAPDGSAIFLLKFGNWNTSDISYEDLQRLILLCLQGALRQPVTQIKGFTVIFDFKGTTLKHLTYGTPGNLLQISQIYLDSSAARFKKFHCINGTMAMRLAYAIISSFLSEKMRNRVIFHKHPTDLTEYIDKEALPVEYGGVLENYYNHEWLKESNKHMNASVLGGQPNAY